MSEGMFKIDVAHLIGITLDDPDPERDCLRCEVAMAIDHGDEPTPLCNYCAHDVSRILADELRRMRTRDARIPSLDQLDALLTKYRADSHGEPIDLLGAIQTAEARAEAARSHVDPNVRRVLLLDCAAWALAAVCEIDGAQASAPVAVTREANDEGSGP